MSKETERLRATQDALVEQFGLVKVLEAVDTLCADCPYRDDKTPWVLARNTLMQCSSLYLIPITSAGDPCPYHPATGVSMTRGPF